MVKRTVWVALIFCPCRVTRDPTTVGFGIILRKTGTKLAGVRRKETTGLAAGTRVVLAEAMTWDPSKVCRASATL